MLVHHDPRLRIGLDKPHLKPAEVREGSARVWRCAMEDTIPAFDKDPAVALRVWRGLYAHMIPKPTRPTFCSMTVDGKVHTWFVRRMNVIPYVPYKGDQHASYADLARCAPRFAVPCDDVVDGPSGKPFEITEYQMPKNWLEQFIEWIQRRQEAKRHDR